MIQPQSGLNQVPLYFEKQFTNQQATLDELKKQLDDIQNNASLTLFSNPLYQATTTTQQPQQGLAPGRRREGVKGDAIPLPNPDEMRRDLATAQTLLGQYQSDDRRELPSKNVLKERMNTIFDRHQIPTTGRYQNRVAQLENKVNDLTSSPEVAGQPTTEETETQEDVGFSLFD
jgi:polyhydroxyalkanoate synthesis regulator phasin